MTKTFVSSLLAIAFAAPLAAQDTTVPQQQLPGTFSLPPAPSPTPTVSDVQGPIDPQAPYETRPRAELPVATPSQRAIANPSPAPTLAPSAVRPSVRLNGNSMPRFTPAPTPQVDGAQGKAAATPDIEITPTDSPPIEPATPTQSVAESPSPSATLPAQSAEPAPNATLIYALAGLLAAIFAAAALAIWRRRAAQESDPPEILRPKPLSGSEPARSDKEPAPAETPAAIVANAPMIRIDAVPVSLSRSFMNVTLTVQLTISNSGGSALDAVVVEADLISAHAREPSTAQMADPANPLPAIHQFGTLEANSQGAFEATLSLPVGQVRPLSQQSNQPYVPLFRVRAIAQNIKPAVRTFLVGKIAPDQPTKVIPFQLAEMPQVHNDIGLKPLD